MRQSIIFHLLGFSVFNPDAVKDLKLYKGEFNQDMGCYHQFRYMMKDGNSKELNFWRNRFIFSRFTIESPIVKDKSSFILVS